MPVELTIVETINELGVTVSTVVLESASAPGPAGVGVPAGGTAGQVLTKDTGTDFDTSWQDATGGGGGGTVDSVVAGAGVSVDATDPANPVVTAQVTQAELDAEAAARASADTALDGRLDTLEAVDNATQAELNAHAADTTGVHGIADTSALETTTGAQAKADAAQAAAVQRANHTGTQLAATISDLVEAIQDAVGGMATDSATVNFTYDDTAGTLTAVVQGLTTSDVSGLTEAIDDRVAALLVAGTGITLTYDDVAGTLTIAATGGGGGTVDSVVAGTSIDVDATDPANPIVSVEAGAFGILAQVTYAPGTDTTIGTTTSATLVDVDATNLAIPFTAPPSGIVRVTLQGMSDVGSVQAYRWGLREGTTTIDECWMASEVSTARRTASFIVTGLTPGSAHTYKWAYRVAAAATTRVYGGPTYGKAILTVEAVNS